ncbi:hypothetical protein OsJ_24072 [Oryza sativa Japonica Group]|uniref:DUF7597 domain-containing protein n=1 Tax=Oryza sativa subsp. japonica TaxID=39947 RepID=B9FX01_ORYSJ|nr:hypothetical protein OsJ_24072 [Oryza sativa Japonica Group]
MAIVIALSHGASLAARVFNRLHVLDPPCPSPVAAGEKVSISAPDPISHKPVSRPKVPVSDGNAPNAISKSFFNFNSGPKAARVLGLSSKSSVLSNGLPIGFGKSRDGEFLDQVRNIRVLASYPHPNVVALFQIRSPVHRDALVLGQPIAYDEEKQQQLEAPPNRPLDDVPQYVAWEQLNAPNGQSWTIYVYTLNGEFADVFPLDDDLPLGEGPINSSSTSSILAASSGNSTNSVISISSDEAIEHVSDNSLMVQKVFVDANLLRLLCQRFPQVMFDENFVKDASFWSALTSDHHSFQGNASGSSDWASRIVSDSVSVGSDEVLDPTPLAVVPPSDSFLALTAFEDPVMPTKRSYKKRAAGSVTPIVTTGLRRSSRLLAISDGHKIGFKDDDLVEPDPNQRIGNPRGKSVKKLKQVAHEAGLLFSGSSLQESDFMEDSAEVEGPASCPIPLLQKMATNLCGVAPQDVTQESLLASSPKSVPV